MKLNIIRIIKDIKGVVDTFQSDYSYHLDNDKAIRTRIEYLKTVLYDYQDGIIRGVMKDYQFYKRFGDCIKVMCKIILERTKKTQDLKVDQKAYFDETIILLETLLAKDEKLKATKPEIAYIEFGLFGPDEIRRFSVAEIKHTETFENGHPKFGGVFDPRMGCIERNAVCQTCYEDDNHCPGHFGHIELARPVYHVSYIERIKKVLECICIRCARLKLQPDDPEYLFIQQTRSTKARFGLLWKLCKNKTACEYPDCGFKVDSVRRHGGDLFCETKGSLSNDTDTTNQKTKLVPADIRNVLSRIPDDMCFMLGFDTQVIRPEWMILTVLLVPPHCIRPSISMGSGGRGEDDLTYKLCDILRFNKLIRKSDEDNSQRCIDEYEQLLQYHVSTYFDNETSMYTKACQKGGRPLKSISSRISGKEGRIRGNLMGKRVDFSARSVITGDPVLELEELGVPLEIAMTMTYPERVTPHNIEKLQEVVNRGASTYPGARYVTVAATGNKYDLSFRKKPVFLKVGDTVERHMVNGDWVIFNRQPTLHKMSMMAHRVRVLPGKTFRMAISATSPYNALIVSGEANKPVIGIIQDALCGVRKFTLRDVMLNKQQVYNLLMKLPQWDGHVPVPSILKPMPMWTGKQLVSLLFPDVLNYAGTNMSHMDEYGSDPHVEHDTRVLIQDGELVHGSLCKKAVGASQGGIIHILWKDHGPDVCARFINGCQYIVNEWLFHYGFTVGIGDCLIPKDTRAQIKDLVSTTCNAVVGNSALSEGEIALELAGARDNSGKLAAGSLDMTNNFKQMVFSGSKGNLINIAQIAACVGQQNMDGGRIPFGFRNRSLPHFEKFDSSPDARGFVRNSYIDGLSPTEYFFHAMGGREGLIDTACKTSATGYIQRRLVKAMEDISVAYDNTVHTADAKIVQFSYAGDNMDGAHIEKQFIDLIKLSNDQVVRETDGCCQQEVDQIFADREFLRSLRPDSVDGTFYLPVNFKRLLDRSDMRLGADELQMDLVEIFHEVTACLDLLKQTKVASPLFEVFMRWYLRSNALTKVNVPKVLDHVYRNLHKSRVHSGESVGVIAAQSVGHPITQMTLNTFHLSGISNKAVTSGVARITELINCVKHMKTPTMSVFMDSEVRFDREAVKRIASTVPLTVLKDLVQSASIVDWTDRASMHPDETYLLDALARYDSEFQQLCETKAVDNHCIRLVLDRQKLLVKSKTMFDVCTAIESTFDFHVKCIATHEAYGAQGPVVLVFVTDEELLDDDPDILPAKAFLEENLDGILGVVDICGIDGIQDCTVESRTFYEADPITGSMETKVEYFIETTGINLLGVNLIDHADFSRTTCNSPMDVLAVLGVEAAYQSLLNELQGVIEYGGGYINSRHLQVLCDLMTNRGQLMSITRHGINRLGHGFLKKATFEETQDIFMEAAVNCEKDPISGVSERIMVGRSIPSGTGIVSVMESMVKEHTYNPLAPRYLQCVS
ncbi:DNA-directed RNA polymerase II subunit rpb1 [Allomyces arbusculus]|nr:DNA-directed RNA polymerase II subunit rpb1 [Allomyces arbusculus]